MKKKAGYVNLMWMMIVTLFTQILVLIKSSVVAGKFGATNAMDAYNFANSIATFLFGFVSAGISTIVIPEYANKRDKKSVDTFITLIYGAIFFVTVLMIIFRQRIIGAFSNRDTMFVQDVAKILIYLLLFQYFGGITNVTIAYFQCEDKYNIPRIINLISQLAVVATLICIKKMTIMEYTIIICLGILLSFLCDTGWAIKCGWRYKPTCIFNEETRILINRFIPVVVSTGTYNLSLMIDSVISASLEEGKITVLSYSSQISSMINTIIVGNLLIYIYPKITKNIKRDGSQSVFWDQTGLFHAIVCLMIAGFIAVGRDAVFFLFYRDAFSFEACRMVFEGTIIYVFGQQINVIRNMLYRYFYALGDTKTPATNSIMVSIFNITISIILVRVIGFYGVIIGTVVASLLSLTIIMVRFGKKVGYSEKILSIMKKYIINIIIMSITVAVVGVTKSIVFIENDLIRILVFGLETVIVYILLQLLCNRNIVSVLKTL